MPNPICRCLLFLAVLAVPLAGGHADPGESAPPAAWFIEGVVVDATGSPVGGQPVVAIAAAQEPPPGRDPAPASSGTTENDGHFRLTGLAGGERYLVVARGHEDLADAAVRTVAWSLEEPERTVALQLPVGGVLAGTVVGVGRRPVRGWVQAYEHAWPRPQWGYEAGQQAVGWRSRWVAIDPAGRFALRGIPRGSCTVRCVVPSYGEVTTFASTSEPDLQLSLRRSDGTRIAGVVRGPRGGVHGARVVVGWRPELPMLSARAETLTAEDGSYVLEGVGPGVLEDVHVEAEGLLLPEDAPLAWEGRSLTTQGSTRLDLELQTACTLEGTVRDAAGKALPGVTLTAYTPRGSLFESTTRTAVTSSDGTYRMSMLPVGKGQLRPSRAGFTWRKPTADPPTDEAYCEGGGSCFHLGRPGSTARLDFVLDPQTESESRAPLHGRVMDEAGTAVPGARVSLSPQAYDSRERTPYPEPVITDAWGRFRFPAVSRDRLWTAHASAGEKVEARPIYDCAAGQSEAIVITLRPADVTAGRVLDESGAPVPYVNVESWAYPTVNSGPLARHLEARTVTDAEGRFRLVEADRGWAPALQVHGWRIAQTDTVSGPLGGEEPGLPVRIGQDLTLRVRRIQPLSLEGVVHDTDGRPARWRRLDFRVIDRSGAQRMGWLTPWGYGFESWETVTDGAGAFHILRAAGDAEASAFLCEELVEDQRVVEPGRRIEPLRLAPSSAKTVTVKGRLVTPDGQPVERAWIRLEHGDRTPVRAGEFRAEVLTAAERIDWWVHSITSADGAPRLDLEPELQGTLDLPLPEPRVITLPKAQQRHGRVVGPDGLGVAGVVVDVVVTGARYSGLGEPGTLHDEWTVTDAEGRFRIGRLFGTGITLRVHPQTPGAESVEVPTSEGDGPVEIRLEK